MSDEWRYVIATLSQRWDFDRKNAQAIEEILTKATLVDLFLQIPIARSDNADIDFACAGVAEAFKLLFLQYAEQLGLHGEWHFADLIEKQCSAIGKFETSGLVLERTSE
jgi:hypothetical protein